MYWRVQLDYLLGLTIVVSARDKRAVLSGLIYCCKNSKHEL